MLEPATLVRDITTEAVDGLVEELLEEEMSNGTVNRKLAALSRILSRAYEYGKLDRKPKIRKRNEAECRIRFLSDEEEGAMLGIMRQ